jgi:hypothetical protein
MLAHGADLNNIDEDVFRQICVMYADGQIGNRSIVESIGNLTAAVYNYMREPSKPAYELKQVIGNRFYDYLYPPQDNKEVVNNSLLMYVSRAKGFNKDRFKGG